MKGSMKRIRAKEAVRILAKNQERHGLCSTCAKASDCTFPREGQTSILECEEFQGVTQPSMGRMRPSSPLLKGPSRLFMSPSPDRKESNGYKGLCCLCEGRSTCTFPKPEGGVWHCEEYC